MTRDENLRPSPVMVMLPMMIPAAAQAAATWTEPTAPSRSASRMPSPKAFRDSFRTTAMRNEVRTVTAMAQKTARSGE